MYTEIGETAGKIWEALKSEEQLAISKLPKKVNERDVVVYQALGWLARESKVMYQTKGKTTLVSLAE